MPRGKKSDETRAASASVGSVVSGPNDEVTIVKVGKAKKPADAHEVVPAPAKSRKRKQSDDNNGVLHVDAPPVLQTPDQKNPPQPKKKAKKADTIVADFVADILPGLKREMKNQKKSSFDIVEYADYFKPNSGWTATYILPLFYFLRTNEIICNRYGIYDGRHMVKTTAGFNRVVFLSQNTELEPDVREYIAKRYGKEWHKIPAKDGFKAKAAFQIGFQGEFKLRLVDIFEDEFKDSKTDDIIKTINPILQYEAVSPPAPKKERVKKQVVEKDEPGENDWIDTEQVSELPPGVYSVVNLDPIMGVKVKIQTPLSPPLAQEDDFDDDVLQDDE